MVTGRISFIGAGPGAADLITVRGARRIAEADIVVWAASLVAPECIQEHARSDAELVDSSRLTHEQALEIYRRAERDKLNVARVHSGDPSLWGAVQEQHDACARMNLEVEIVPGVPAFSAAAAAVGRELTVPEVAQSLVLTRLEGGKTPMPEGEKVREFAKHGTTMALFLSAARTGQLVEELRAGGYPDDTPVLVAYKVTWPDELLLRTNLADLEKTVKQHKLWRHTLFIVGKGLASSGTRSHLYHAGHFHTYRRADPAARRALRAERPTAARRRAESDSEPAPRTEGSGERVRDSDVAWWAVRDWQESARGSARVAANRAAPARRVDAAQSQLFTDDVAAGERPVDAVEVSERSVRSDAGVGVVGGERPVGAVEGSEPGVGVVGGERPVGAVEVSERSVGSGAGVGVVGGERPVGAVEVSEQSVRSEAPEPKPRRTSAASTTATRATAKAVPAKRGGTKSGAKSAATKSAAKPAAAKRTKSAATTTAAAKAKPAAQRKSPAQPDEQGE
ncbi:precorrin-4 C(11)-methyltransferase [Saccharopolyspora spinosa]|uniref:precorrin-4 C(11)-methyltransferase n=1 Tax=Saccharopolyspora spinosa TaxID=60894 RepID=UPI000237B5EA|nr:precorrin-4 C(11)-methyltransferase [Saccharopolyspora spinosa]